MKREKISQVEGLELIIIGFQQPVEIQMEISVQKTLLAIAALLTMSITVRADGWTLNASGTAHSECGGRVATNVVAFQGISGGVTSISTGNRAIDQTCSFGIIEVDAHDTFQATAGFGDVSGNVLAKNGTADASAKYIDDITLHPPAGFEGSGVSFAIASSYDINVNGGNGDANGGLTLEVPAFAQSKTFFADSKISGNGDFKGMIETGLMIFVKCPCTTEFTLAGEASAGEALGPSASASFSDPLTFVLPEGWTYTLASQETSSAIPEPNTIALISSVLVIFAIRRTFR